jgi:ribosomal protein L11 methylase PrmA
MESKGEAETKREEEDGWKGGQEITKFVAGFSNELQQLIQKAMLRNEEVLRSKYEEKERVLIGKLKDKDLQLDSQNKAAQRVIAELQSKCAELENTNLHLLQDNENLKDFQRSAMPYAKLIRLGSQMLDLPKNRNEHLR